MARNIFSQQSIAMSNLPADWQTTPQKPGDMPQQPPHGPRRPWAALTTVLVVVGAICLVLIPLGSAWIPQEIARLHQANAANKALDDDYAGAVDSIDQALQWDPDRQELRLYRARYQLDGRNIRGALADLSALIMEDPKYEPAYRLRAEAYQALGRYDMAVEDWKRIHALHAEGGARVSPLVLNGLAYARALADVELDEAMEDINVAIDSLREDAALLDTRGFIVLQAGNPKDALVDLDKAVKLAERSLEKSTESAPVYDARYHEKRLATQRREVAVLRYHRALAYQQLGRTREASEDLERVRELGFEPHDKLH